MSTDFFHSLAGNIGGDPAATNTGPFTSGEWIPIGASYGFFLPQPLHDVAQAAAQRSGRVQHVGVLPNRTVIFSDRDTLLAEGCQWIAWIGPQ